MKTQADKALYSAKSSGRNRVRYFPDILKRYGRVIENDKVAGALVIDIGSEVGVVPGREFFVVPERYTGDTEYVVDDGRSQRRLGSFPRLRIARVVAFDVQPEISFCSVAEHREGTEIMPGCLLESIPLGLFGGLSTPHGANDGFGEGDAKNVLRQKIASSLGDSTRVVALRLGSIQDVDKQHGSVRANELLAATAAAITRSLPPPVKVVQVEIGNFGIVFSSEQADAKLQQLAASLRGICGDIADFSMGIFGRQTLGALEQEQSSYSLDWENAYDYAVIAAASSEKNSFADFDVESPNRVLAAKLQNEEYEQALADYRRFKEIGISAASLDNFAGLSHFGIGNLQESNAAFRAAVELSPEGSTFRSNYGVTQFLLKRYVEAFEQLRISASLQSQPWPSRGQLGLYAISAFEAHKSNGVPDEDTVERLFEEALATDAPIFVRPEDIKRAHMEFRSRREVPANA